MGAIFSSGCPCAFGSGFHSLGSTEHLVAMPPLKSISSFRRESVTQQQGREGGHWEHSPRRVWSSPLPGAGAGEDTGLQNTKKSLEKPPPQKKTHTHNVLGMSVSAGCIVLFVELYFYPKLKRVKFAIKKFLVLKTVKSLWCNLMPDFTQISERIQKRPVYCVYWSLLADGLLQGTLDNSTHLCLMR